MATQDEAEQAFRKHGHGLRDKDGVLRVTFAKSTTDPGNWVLNVLCKVTPLEGEIPSQVDGVDVVVVINKE